MFSKEKLTIDIRNNIIKFAQGSLVEDRHIKIKNASYLDTHTLDYEGHRIVDSSKNVEILKVFLKKHNFTTKDALICISDDKIITRVISIPKLPLNDIKGLIENQSSKYFPIDTEKYYIDYKILSVYQEGDKPFYKVLLCAILKEVVRDYVDLFLNCGLNPLVVDIHHNCVARIYDDIEYENTAVIDGGIDGVDFLILDRGTFYMNTVFPFSLKDYSELYRDPYNYNKEALKDQLEELSNSINNYIKFYLSRNEGKTIDKIYITGDISLVEGIENIVSSRYGIEIIKGFKNIIHLEKAKRIKDIHENIFCGNIGLLLREAKR